MIVTPSDKKAATAAAIAAAVAAANSAISRLQSCGSPRRSGLNFRRFSSSLSLHPRKAFFVILLEG